MKTTVTQRTQLRTLLDHFLKNSPLLLEQGLVLDLKLLLGFLLAFDQFLGRQGFPHGVANLFAGLAQGNLHKALRWLVVLDKAAIRDIDKGRQDGLEYRAFVNLGFGARVLMHVLFDDGAKLSIARTIVAALAASADHVVWQGFA